MAAWSALTVASNWSTSACCVSKTCWDTILSFNRSVSRCKSSRALASWAASWPFLATGLGDLGLEGQGINLRQHIAGVNVLALLKGDLVQLAVDPDMDRHRVEGLHGAEAIEVNGHVLLLRLGGHHGNILRARAGGGGLGRGGGAVFMHAHQPDDPSDDDHHAHDAENQATVRGGGWWCCGVPERLTGLASILVLTLRFHSDLNLVVFFSIYAVPWQGELLGNKDTRWGNKLQRTLGRPRRNSSLPVAAKLTCKPEQATSLIMAGLCCLRVANADNNVFVRVLNREPGRKGKIRMFLRHPSKIEMVLEVMVGWFFASIIVLA